MLYIKKESTTSSSNFLKNSLVQINSKLNEKNRVDTYTYNFSALYSNFYHF